MRIFAQIHPLLKNKAIIAGASGLIGSNLLQFLLHRDYYQEVVILVRKPLPIEHIKLTQIKVDFDHLDDHASSITGHAAFCCLGSTQKKTPDLAVYRKIDHDYPLALAQIALKNGVEQYHLVSALGASANASNFYIKMKGETENDIKNVGMPCLHIYRPALLTGQRNESRPAERFFTPIMKMIDPLLFGGLKKYRSIPAATVASAMYNQSINNGKGVFIHPSDEIKQLS
jgi:uncharacterized protein YbjT (DUF2867 family)